MESALTIRTPSSKLTMSVVWLPNSGLLCLKHSQYRPDRTAVTSFTNIQLTAGQFKEVQNALILSLSGEIVINTVSGSARFTQPLVKSTP